MHIPIHVCVCMCTHIHLQNGFHHANSFALPSAYSWHFPPLRGGWARRDSPSAGTLSSLFSCFDTWQQQFCFFPAASFSSHLLRGPPIKSERHTFKRPWPNTKAVGSCVLWGLVCLYICCLCIYLPRAFMVISETRRQCWIVSSCCEPPIAHAGSSSPLEEREVLLTTAPSLQPRALGFCMNSLHTHVHAHMWVTKSKSCSVKWNYIWN